MKNIETNKGETKVRFAKTEEKETVLEIWKEAFGENESGKLLFSMIPLLDKHVMAVVRNNRIVSILTLLECSYAKYRGIYLYGLATRKEYRKQGYMTEGIEAVKKYAKYFKFDFLWLIPEKRELFEFYKNRGFDVKVMSCVDVDIEEKYDTDYKSVKFDTEVWKRLQKQEWLHQNSTMRFDLQVENFFVCEMLNSKASYCKYVEINDDIKSYALYYHGKPMIVENKQRKILYPQYGGFGLLCEVEKNSLKNNNIIFLGYIPF